MTFKSLLQQLIDEETEYDWISEFLDGQKMSIDDLVIDVDWARLIVTVVVHETVVQAKGDTLTNAQVAKLTNESMAKLTPAQMRQFALMVITKYLDQ